MNKIALDTNIAVQLLNGTEEIMNQVRQYEVIFLPVTVNGELLFGAKNSARKEQNLPRFRDLIRHCEILDINESVAEVYSDIRLLLKEKGTPIPENDIWIAATCIVNNLPLLTRDHHFENIENLTLVKIV